ncbi:(d)CMP kinase [Agarilytica rhodophyticola]|uniref:(d)CMP kinase n=1 Tax=Agarilytica rhodophyticola TaxID=1737490 RepID=UPI000B347715|nr:(d)CMP kinase [Agarilytica rhodophyticola]
MIPVVTIDGPSGAGKGTVCRRVANKTGFLLLDSGALYRLTALACINHNIDLADQPAVAMCAQQLDVQFNVSGDSTSIILEGSDVSKAIRTENVGMVASKVAAYPKVREALLQRQRDFCLAPGLVADGRDMGTVVFPNAGVKIFLTASAHERAQRRCKQLLELGQTPDFASVLADIEARDKNDRSRKSAPLVPAEDAIEVDSTNMTIDEVTTFILAEIEKKYTGKTSC